MNTLTVNQDPPPARLSTRRATLERQCSVSTHSGGAADAGQSQSSPKQSFNHSSSRSLSTGQSTDDVFGLPSASSQTSEAQTNTFTSSADKSSNAGTLPMSKAGRKRKHPMKPGKHVCTYCGRQCAKPSVLEKHIRMHTGERPYPCEICDLSFKTKSNLYKHRKSIMHKQKGKEKGLSMESMFGESFGSSRDESIDLEGDDDSLPHGITYKRASSLGGLPDKKLLNPGLAVRQPSYMETLQHLEQVYDAIDDYAKRMKTVVCKRAHWLLDKDCIVSIQLQHPPSDNAVSTSESHSTTDARPAAPSGSCEDAQVSVTNPTKAGEENAGSIGRRRLSRQHSVSSPAVHMFDSIAPPTAASTPPPLPHPITSSSSDSAATSTGSILDSPSKLPDGEQLLKHLRQIIHLNTNIDPNIKLWMHKQCMEVKLKLFIPDVAARRKGSQGLSTDNSMDNQLDRSMSIDHRFTCLGCGQSFTREHILEIHSAFFCHGQLSASDNQSSSNYLSPPGGDSSVPVGKQKKMKLLKTGSEDSYVYVIADEGYNQSRYSKQYSEVPIAAKPAPLHQQSSTDVGSDGASMKQQLKKHVLKHMSQGSLGTDVGHGSLSSVSDMLSLDKSMDEDNASRQDSSTPVSLPATAAKEALTTSDSSLQPATQSRPDSTPNSLPTALAGSPKAAAISTVILDLANPVAAPPPLVSTTSSNVSQYVRISPRISTDPSGAVPIQPTYIHNSPALIKAAFYAIPQCSAFIGADSSSPYTFANAGEKLGMSANNTPIASYGSNTVSSLNHALPQTSSSLMSSSNNVDNYPSNTTSIATEKSFRGIGADDTASVDSEIDNRPATVCVLDDTPPAESAMANMSPIVSIVGRVSPAVCTVSSVSPAKTAAHNVSHELSSDNNRVPITHNMNDASPAMDVISSGPPIVTNMDSRPSAVSNIDRRSPAINAIDNRPPIVSNTDSQPPLVSNIDRRSPAINVIDNRPPIFSNTDSQPPLVSNIDRRSPAINVIDNRPPIVSNTDSQPPLVSNIDRRSPVINVIDNRPPIVSNTDSQPPLVSNIDRSSPAISVHNNKPPIVTSLDSKPSTVSGIDERSPAVIAMDKTPPTANNVISRPLTAHNEPLKPHAMSAAPPTLHSKGNRPPAMLVTDIGPPTVSGDQSRTINGRPSELLNDEQPTVNPLTFTTHSVHQAFPTLPASSNQGFGVYGQIASNALLLPVPIWRKVAPIALKAPSVPVSMPSIGPPLLPKSLPVTADTAQVVRYSPNHMVKPAPSTGSAFNRLANIRASTDAPELIKSSNDNPKLLSPAIIPSRRDTDRVSSLRRRFSQTRSRSSVSFEDPPVKQPTHLSVPVLAAAVSDAQVSMESSQVPQTVSVSACSSQSSSPPPSIQPIISKSQPPSDTSSVLSIQHVDFTLVYCTVHCRPVSCVAEVAQGSSSYSERAPSKTPLITGLGMDMNVPLSCYNCMQRLLGNRYSNSDMDTRSIFTHSSYWQYKNKMRVMQPMPKQPSPEVTPIVVSTRVPSPPTTAVTTQNPPIQLLVSSTPSSSATVSSSESTCAVSRPSVIAKDVPYKKKLLHRSQSTPNAGEESQSKLIAGGFKSDEDYVYIRGRGKGKFVCQQCGIRCRKPSMLKKHIRTHTDLRPYSCKHCNFSFKTKGNLTKHMRSKAHHRRCLELHIVPVPLTVEDNQIDLDILASQQKLSRESKIKGAKLTDQDKDNTEGSDVSDDEDDDDDTSDDDSSEDDALHIDESSDDTEKSQTSADLSSMAASLSIASLRRVHSMPAHHIQNSFDASSLAEMLPTEPKPALESVAPPPKKRKRNHLNLTISMSNQLVDKEKSSNKIRDDIAMSLLDLSMTPVHGTPTLTTPLLRAASTISPSAADVKRVSVVRSTKATASYADMDNNEPIDLRVQSKTTQLKFICPLCRAICNNQEGLDAHMKLHDGPVIEVPIRSTRRLTSKSLSFGGSFDAESGSKSINVQTPQTPNQLRRQHAISLLDSDAEEDDVDHLTQAEPGGMLSEAALKRKCPYCPKVFHNDSAVPQHIKTHHLITQEYVCTYKDCGNKFTNKQDLTYHLGTHALDDNDKYQPISIPKCGICEKTFKSMNNLKQHLQHHSEARPHVCEYCDAGFTTAQSLKHHLKTHTQERPYVCGECGSTFARSDHLTQHNKTHNKHVVLDIPNRGASQAPTILNPAGVESQHPHNW